MAKLKKAVTWRRLERPYTRKSKYKILSYVRGTPTSKVIRYVMGNSNIKFDTRLFLISKSDLQIRHNAIESARQASNRLLEKVLGKDQYRFVVRMYPHHILRENPLAAGAGADRMSTGMARSFGKAVGLAAQVKEGKIMFEVDVNKQHIETARQALTKAKTKIPCSCSIVVESVKN
ncbi:MAG: 50S ribosomal protein L16 [Nanoarchaeota archaeon]|nr:50S ribosomal protein L16 [Nanoarchaeota archaeon]